MKWIEIFKIYNLKQIKKEKILFLFTTLSILIATSISLIIPVVNLENQDFIERNIKEINGGDLRINLNGEKTEEFNKKISEFKDRGLDVKESIISNCYYKKSSNNVISSIVIGEYSLNDDEIILQSTLANSLNVKVGDFVELDTQGNGRFKFKVKEIEAYSSGVDRDADLVGYGKVQKTEALSGISGREVINIKGSDGKSLKDELLKVDDSNFYTTIMDKKSEVKDELFIQKSTLGILSTVGYIFSILAIISTTIMLILKRKRDIAILRLISVDVKEIKKAIRTEISLWLLAPIILSGFVSYYGVKGILNWSGINISKISLESVNLILKGMLFNGLVFFILINIALMIIKGINAMAVIREDEKIIKRENKKIIIITMLLIPLFLIGYAIYAESIESLGSSLIVILLIIIFLGIVTGVLKLLTSRRFKSPLLMYSVKSIKNRFFSFVLVLLSLTLTLWFILIGFNLESSIKENFKSSLEEILPYNYYIETKDNISLENILENHEDIIGYIKSYTIDGRVVNKEFNNMFKSVSIEEVNKEDYGISYKIIQGSDLFTGEYGIIISDKMREMNSLDVGDILEIQTSKGIITEKIKGVYESAGINTLSIYKEGVELGEKISYLVKSENSRFIDNLTNSSIMGVGDLGDRIAANISSFLKVFRLLSIICLLGTILFNINMVYMNCIKDNKDEEILMALGFEKIFVIKVQVVKMILLVCFSTLLSLGIYSVIVKLFFMMMINSTGEISTKITLITVALAITISVISFNVPLRKVIKKKELSLLREAV